MDLHHILTVGIAFVVALTVHEFAHALAAYTAGDDTPKQQGRLSLNPLDHLDPMGTIMFVIIVLANPAFGFAWGKPVQTNPYNYKNPRTDNIKVALWGPASNIIVAFALAMVLRFVPLTYSTVELIDVIIRLNLGIAFFNLIPIAPLDGSHVVSGLLPTHQARKYDTFMGKYGLIILLVMIISGASFFFVRIPASILYAMFLGLL